MVKKAEKKEAKQSQVKADSCNPCEQNPFVGIAKVIGISVLLLAAVFLLFGSASETVYLIPISMGLVLLGIVLAVLIARKK